MARCLGFLSVVLDVQFRRFRCVMGGVVGMAVCRVRMMGGCQMVTRLVVPCGFPMMSCRVLVVLGGAEMMLRCLL